MKELFQFKEFDLSGKGNTLEIGLKRVLFLIALFVIPMLLGILSIVFLNLPIVGYIVGALILCYLPLYFKRGKPTVKINDNFQVAYTAPKGVNRELLTKSISSIIVFCILFTFGFYALYDRF
jgi:hypothetical protein